MRTISKLRGVVVAVVTLFTEDERSKIFIG